MSKRAVSLIGLDKWQGVSIYELQSRENLNGLDKWQGVSIDELQSKKNLSRRAPEKRYSQLTSRKQRYS